MGSSNRIMRKTALSVAMGLCLAWLAVPPAHAANNDGAVVGRAQPGAVVTLVSPDTGLTRSVTADDKGNYRFAFLPIGRYTLTSSEGGAAASQPIGVTVSLGNTTTVNVGARAATDLAAVTVSSSSINSAFDITSTESATNLTREQLTRIPVDRNVDSVALLAPGVTKGHAGFGGISFGGSSIAENAFYVNGLNVTDFYNRNGFSEAPYAFYQEFQVKTGGYSVEFGRTTGGVVNAVARSGTNQFHYGADFTMSPGNWHSSAKDRYAADGSRYITASRDQPAEFNTDAWMSGPIIKDKLFFFGMYQIRGNTPRNTNNRGDSMTVNGADSGFWGGTIDWNVTDSNTLSLMAFSDKNHNVGDVYGYDFDTNVLRTRTNQVFSDTGGRNWSATWTSYFTDSLSMKLMYGENKREAFTRSKLDLDCNFISVTTLVLAQDDPGVNVGCTNSSTVFERNDTRQQYRADFEWNLGDHLLRFGYDHEKNVSDYARHYAGPGEFFYNIYTTTPGSTIDNGGVVPAGYNAYVRQRQYQIAGTFPSINSAIYVEDAWSVTPNLTLSLGLRNDSFDNQDAAGRSYIKISRQLAPRFGFSWDMKGDGTTKLFGNLGRYYLPVANVINIKQAGGLLDRRTYFGFDGWEIKELNGVPYAVPKLGTQIGAVDESQGDGTVGDLRSEVDKNVDPVYQDEAIIGFQQLFTDKWSWGVSAIYRRLHNAIDDMEISATSQCGEDGYIGWVMANPGTKVTVWGDTNCDGEADGYLTVDTSKEGWAMYNADGDYLGQRGWVKPKRSYTALEFQLDRAWDEKWAFNATYVLSWNRGNAEGPINSDTNFDDTGRTENFDNPWVNTSNGYLPNDRRHQLKLRGTYALTPHWQFGATLSAQSGGPVTGYGVGNPFDGKIYHSYYICVENCKAERSEDRVYAPSPRGGYGHLGWTYNLGASISYVMPLDDKGAGIRVKLSVYNLLNQQRTLLVDQDLQTSIGNARDANGNDTGIGATNPDFRQPIGFQSPRYAQLTVSLNF